MADDATSALRAVAHPVRLQILSLLTGAELSAAEVARELGLTHANASYHLRVLHGAGQLEIASEERIRGGVAKRYRHRWQRDLSTSERRTSVQERELFARAMAEELVRRMRRSRTGGARAWSTDAELWVTPEDYESASNAIYEASATLHDGARPPRTEGTIRVGFTAALFEMEPDSPEAPS
jgi:DNA-binding transcriptional ArsR family regulator